jgi:Ni/Co efflux regulator RcnB
MKKLLLGAIALSVIGSPAIAAPDRDWNHREPARHGDYRGHDDHDRGYRAWRKGDRFDYRQARNYRVINEWRSYRGRRLYAPPRGYHWVRSGNDAVLVAVTGGLIGAVIAGAFN